MKKGKASKKNSIAIREKGKYLQWKFFDGLNKEKAKEARIWARKGDKVHVVVPLSVFIDIGYSIFVKFAILERRKKDEQKN